MKIFADVAEQRGRAMAERFTLTGESRDIEAAVDAYCKALDVTPDDTPRRAAYLSGLASALHLGFGLTNASGDLDAAVGPAGDAVDASPAGHQDRPTLLHNLATMRFTRYEQSGSADDLEAAVTAAREAVATPPADPPGRRRLGPRVRLGHGRGDPRRSARPHRLTSFPARLPAGGKPGTEGGEDADTDDAPAGWHRTV
ncbi:hypothetical protein AB0941_13375 [Streptomyces sp. NPDC013433]|uniref:hypothetical protein n=1 Tax=Streptomyces sp. NPDC013433 TaxID=3155604 RepID=UPI0034566151